jgi:hypothetical protein
MTRQFNDMLQWDDKTERFAPGWYVGSEDENGAHRRDEQGWPYNVHRRGGDVGVTDMVLCGGIQAKGDAYEIARMLNHRLGIDRYR